MTTEREALEKCVEALRKAEHGCALMLSYHGPARLEETTAAHVAAQDGYDAASETLSLAESVLKGPQADADGWIEWKGGDCPIRDHDAFEYRSRIGKQLRAGGPAYEYTWEHSGSDYDIIAYRIVKD